MSGDAACYDAREGCDPEERERRLFTRLPAFLNHARDHAPACARLLAGVNGEDVRDREALAALPLTRKSDLGRLQREAPPFGGFVPGRAPVRKIFSSPGPVYEPESGRADYWRLARALYAAGFRRGELVHNSYSYHLTPAGSMLESAAFALGCKVVPGGTGQTGRQVETIADLRPDAYTGTPSFLKILLDRAREIGADTTSLRKASVSGEALPESLRAEFRAMGVRTLQTYATADVGLIAYESPAMEGLIAGEDLILEIVRPGSGTPLPPGEVGEVVVTVFNEVYPLIRFATGDLSAILPGTSPCGRTNQRIRGWMGRADQTTKVRGLFVRPEQVNAVAACFPELAACRMTVSNPGNAERLCLRCETPGGGEALRERIAREVRERCGLRSEVELVAPGALPRDGKVIEDLRTRG